MQILFVGNANSFLIINLAIKFKEYYPSFEIDILSEALPKTERSKRAFRTVYAVNDQSKWSQKKYIKVLWYAWSYWKLINKIKSNYEVVHIFYLSSIYRLVWTQLKVKGKSVIISVFGSEFYRANTIIKMMQDKMVRQSKIIAASNEQTLKQFSNFFKVPESKQRLCRFGLSILDEIEKVTIEELHQFKNSYHVPKDAVVIACGYNASINQNLETVLQQISLVKESLGTIVLFFQFPPTSSKEYTDKLINQIKIMGIPFVIFSKYFTEKELAVYRKSVDVFIQVQNTDQLSGSMLEFLFSGCNVITGSWLPYHLLDDLKVDYLKVNSLQDIGKILSLNLNRTVNVRHNKQVIKQLCGWDTTISTWRNLYN